jgi:hypothetical protein
MITTQGGSLRRMHFMLVFISLICPRKGLVAFSPPATVAAALKTPEDLQLHNTSPIITASKLVPSAKASVAAT